MTPGVANLVREVLDLDLPAQKEIVEALLVSLKGEPVDPGWLADAQQRFEAIRSDGAWDRGREEGAAGFEAGAVPELPPTWEDPIVAEVHRIREELLEEFDGDLDALMEDTDRRLLAGEFGEYKIVSFPPRRPPGWSAADSPNGS